MSDSSIKNDELAEIIDDLPEELPILPLRNMIVFPYTIMHLPIGVPRSERLIKDAIKGNRLIGLITSKAPDIEEPNPGQLYEVGTIASITRVFQSPDNSLNVIVQGVERFKVKSWTNTFPYLTAKIVEAPDYHEEGMEFEAMVHSLRDLAKEVVKMSPSFPENASNFIDQIEDPRYLTYMTAANHGLGIDEAQSLLEADDLKDKIRVLISHLTHQKEILMLDNKIKSEAKETLDKAHKEYFLRQQLKAIQKELGESEDGQAESEIEEYEQKFREAGLPEEAEKEARRELKRLSGMSPHSAEHPVIKNYLDWIVDLPWKKLSEDQLDIEHARKILDEDHYDLQDVKDRLIEYLAVRKLVRDRGMESEPGSKEKASEAQGAILCFAGPPGVGKTSLGKSIARALGRKFTRMSLGGMRDEAEIRGHRRTYIGAMPGRIIQAIKRAGTRNPIFMLDEIDKIGSDWRGDPSSALLEVLDPAQNHAFRDHYLDVDFDLSDVIFITTANQLDTIPAPLRDRMEIIQLEGYTEHEKVKIAQGYLVPRQIKVNGISSSEIIVKEDALRKIIQDYTREAGVRNLERQIGSVCRKVAVKIAANEIENIEITPELVREYLKKEKYESEMSESIEIPGIATGLAVTATGGDILFIEATRMKGSGHLSLTGQLGDVMKESAEIAFSYVKAKTQDWDLPKDIAKKEDFHIHVPAGAIPKDGPSAGIAMVMAMTSLFTGRPIKSKVGMTGEVTLRGRVLPVGGIKMKVLAAHRAGLKTVILPKRNEADLDELPEEVRKDIEFILVERIEEALNAAIKPSGKSGKPAMDWFYDRRPHPPSPVTTV
ncbi:MAG: endopeptidase La [Deltaproteobacteria bacterium]|nr:endopeptidase La [Deltaproteobacteria bacterium]